MGGEDVTSRFEPSLPLDREVLVSPAAGHSLADLPSPCTAASHATQAINGFDPVIWLIDWARQNLGWTNDAPGAFNAATAGLRFPLRSLAQGGWPNTTSITYTLAPADFEPSGTSTSTTAGEGAAVQYEVDYQYLVLLPSHNASQFREECQREAPPPVVNCTATQASGSAQSAPAASSAAHGLAVAQHLASTAAAPRRALRLAAASPRHLAVATATTEALEQLQNAGVDLHTTLGFSERLSSALHASGGNPHHRVAEHVDMPVPEAAKVSVGATQASPDEVPFSLGGVLPRELQARGVSGSSVVVTTVFNSLNRDGLALRVYEDELTGLSTTILTVRTFNPPSVSSCFAVISSTPCPTEQERRQADACYSAAVNAFLNNAGVQALETVQDYGSAFAIDLVGNGGGNIVLGQLLMTTLFSTLHAAPDLASASYDFHPSPLLLSMGQYSLDNDVALPDFPLAGLLLRDGRSTATESGAMSRMDWYSEGVRVPRGARPATPYSKQFYLLNLTATVSPDAAPAFTLVPEHTMLITDLQCGSMCAQFAHAVAGAGLAKVLGLGGVPWLAADATAFTGGFVTSNAESLTRVFEAAQQQGYTVPGDGSVSAPTYLPTSAITSFNFGAAVSTLYAPAYTQFVALRPSARLMAWTSGSLPVDTAALAARMEPLVPLSPLSADSRVPPGPPAAKKADADAEAKLQRATTLAISFGALFGLAVIVIVILAYMLFCKKQHSGHRVVGDSEVRDAYPAHQRRDGYNSTH